MAKILIVEDEPAQREALHDKLKAEGFEVIKAKNGLEGIEVAQKERPDLMLVDIIMPVMDGITMLKKMRSDEQMKQIPVIVLTNLSEAHVALEGENVHDFLVKANWKLQDLIDLIEKRLGQEKRG